MALVEGSFRIEDDGTLTLVCPNNRKVSWDNGTGVVEDILECLQDEGIIE